MFSKNFFWHVTISDFHFGFFLEFIIILSTFYITIVILSDMELFE